MADFDLLIIGAGSAGLSIAAGAAQLGVKTALVERAQMGGDCLNAGCVPSKALLAAAHAANGIRDASRFGITAPPPALEGPTAGWPIIDWNAVRAHVHGVIAAIAPNDSEARFTALGVTVLRGEARFTGPDSVSVDGRRLTAKRFVIAAGSRAAVPPIPGLAEVPFWTNETVFALPERPDHLLILGGGPIGLEMADAFAGLGARVTVIEAAPSIAIRDDPELVAGLRRALGRRGIAILEGVSVTAAAPGPVLTLSDGRRVEGSHLLVTTGRRPNVEALSLESAGLTYGRTGIATDAGLRCRGNRRVYAAGDIADPAGIGPRGFTHAASYHAALVIRRAVFRLPAKLDYRAFPRAIYTHPELAQVGMTETEAREAGLSVSVLRWPLAENDRAATERDEDGLVKLVVRGNRVVGAGILAPNAGEMIGLWTLAIARKVPMSALAGLIAPYPTRAEAGKRAAGSFFVARLFSSRTKAVVRLFGRLP